MPACSPEPIAPLRADTRHAPHQHDCCSLAHIMPITDLMSHLCRIRKCWLDGAEVALVGEKVDLTYPYEHVGAGASALGDKSLAEKLKLAERPAVLVGPGILRRPDREAVMKQVGTYGLPVPAGSCRTLTDGRNEEHLQYAAGHVKLYAEHLSPPCCRYTVVKPKEVGYNLLHGARGEAQFMPLPSLSIAMLQIHQLVEAGNVVKPEWNGYNVLHDAASRVAALDIGFLPSASARQVSAAD